MGPVTERTQVAGADVAILVRRALLLVALAAAITAVLAGLARLGVGVGWGPSHAGGHGPLFALGVFGTVIALERAVALGRGAALLAPIAGAVAAVLMLVQSAWAPWAAVVSSSLLVIVNVAIVARQAAAFTLLMLVGAAVLCGGNLLWALGLPIFDVLSMWVAFFVITIVSERLELSRLAPTPRWASRALLVLAVIGASSSCARALGEPGWMRAFGVSLVLLAAWQLSFDLARRTLRQAGLPRFAALGVLSAAAWLLVGGVLMAAFELPSAGPRFDAAVHAIFVGYVLSMVFAHAPIILPAVARVQLPFHPILYVPLALLHATLAARVVGDLVGHSGLREVGGIGNALSLAAFAASVLFARVRRGA